MRDTAGSLVDYLGSMTVSGWTCGSCGAWVPSGYFHDCSGTSLVKAWYTCPKCGQLVGFGDFHDCPGGVETWPKPIIPDPVVPSPFPGKFGVQSDKQDRIVELLKAILRELRNR